MAEQDLKQVMLDAIVDADSLERFINGSDSETVLTRLSAEYPTLQKALKELFENGGIAGRFKTLAELQVSGLVDGDYALVADDVVDNNGIYIKESGVWVKSEYGNYWSSEITDIKQRLYRIFPEEGIGMEVSIPHNNYYVRRSDGALAPYADYGVTDFIRVYAGDTVDIKVFSGSASGTVLALYDNDYNFIKAFFTDSSYNAILLEESVAIPSSGYIRVQNRFANTAEGTEDGINSLSNPTVNITTDIYSEGINTIIAKYLSENYSPPTTTTGLTSNGDTCVIRQGSSLLCLGASYATNDKAWFQLLCAALGVTGVNKAVSGQGISHVATSLFKNTLLTQDILDSCEAIILSHLWDFNIMARKDVTISGVSYTEEVVDLWTVADYEDKAASLLNTATLKANMTDNLASFFFDYVVKKMKLVFYNERLKSVSPFYNKKEGKPFNLVLTTNWHDGRPKYNSSVRVFCQKWCLPLIELDKNIGFGLTAKHPSGSQESLLYATDNYAINGVSVGHHFIGGENSEVPRRIAGIAKKTFVVL